MLAINSLRMKSRLFSFFLTKNRTDANLANYKKVSREPANFFGSSVPPGGAKPAKKLGKDKGCRRSVVRFPGRSNRHNVANGLPPLRCFLGTVLLKR